MERIWHRKPEVEGGGVLPCRHFHMGRGCGYAGGGQTQVVAASRARFRGRVKSEGERKSERERMRRWMRRGRQRIGLGGGREAFLTDSNDFSGPCVAEVTGII